jgi:hypothetical protein
MGLFKLRNIMRHNNKQGKFNVVKFMPLFFTQDKTLVNWNLAKRGFTSFAKAIPLIFVTSNKPIMT